MLSGLGWRDRSLAVLYTEDTCSERLYMLMHLKSLFMSWMWMIQHVTSKNISTPNWGPKTSCYFLQYCSEITTTCPFITIFRTTFSSNENVLSSNLNCLNIYPYLHMISKLRNESTAVSSVLCCQCRGKGVFWIWVLLGIQQYKSDLKTDSLLQVQEGPETDCRWALKAFAKGDKAYFVHSEGVW